jgi:hypothetical protein
MNASVESDALHARVQRFARDPLAGESFDELALDIARFQERRSAGFARLVAHSGRALDQVASIPAVPAEAFRLTRVAVHPIAEDVARFRTSGTTAAASGVHAMRRLDTYRTLSVGFGRSALESSLGARATVVALALAPGDPPSSSLGCMMRFFMQDFGGAREHWLVDDAGVDVERLAELAEQARGKGQPLLVLATAFALVAVLDRLGARVLRCPEATLVMVTGGFKGRTRSVDPAPFRAAVAASFGLDARRVVGEYGMTELTSQLYEGTAPGAELEGPAGVYLEPPWLRVTAVDPATLEPVRSGDTGVARFVDLGNIDSAVAVLTDDLVRRVGPGIELCGRRSASPTRGCSLAVEALVEASPPRQGP